MARGRGKSRRANAIPPSIQYQASYLAQQKQQNATSSYTISHVAKSIHLDDGKVPGLVFPEIEQSRPSLVKEGLDISKFYHELVHMIENSVYHISIQTEHDITTLENISTRSSLIPDELLSGMALKARRTEFKSIATRKMNEKELEDIQRILSTEKRESRKDLVSMLSSTIIHDDTENVLMNQDDDEEENDYQFSYFDPGDDEGGDEGDEGEYS